MKKLIFILLITSIFSNLKSQEIAPDFKGNDVMGNYHHLYNYLGQGKYVLIDFFYASCGGCTYFSRSVDSVYRAFGCNLHDIIVLGINKYDNNAQVLVFDSINNLIFPSLSAIEGGGANICESFDIKVFPTVMLIAPDTTIIQKRFSQPYAYLLTDSLVFYGNQPKPCIGTEADIKNFGFSNLHNPQLSNDFYATISNSGNNEININLPEQVDLTNLIATFSLSANANAFIQNVLQISNETSNDFSQGEKIYSIVSEDLLTQKNWKVKINTFTQNTTIQNKIWIYPNPVTDLITIKGLNKEQSVIIRNITGTIIYKARIPTDNISIPLKNYPEGIYFISLISDESMVNYKIIKQ